MKSPHETIKVLGNTKMMKIHLKLPEPLKTLQLIVEGLNLEHTFRSHLEKKCNKTSKKSNQRTSFYRWIIDKIHSVMVDLWSIPTANKTWWYSIFLQLVAIDSLTEDKLAEMFHRAGFSLTNAECMGRHEEWLQGLSVTIQPRYINSRWWHHDFPIIVFCL